MSPKGFSHIGLSTLDLDKTRDFYENILGFRAVRCDVLKVKEGGRIRHVFFDTGRDQLIAFMEARGVPGVPAEYDAGINRGLGVPNVFYHFAFEAGSEAGLEEKRNELLAKGVEVTEVVDHDWAKSIYFKDPNGIQLEFCSYTRNLNADDARMQDRAEISVRRLGLQDPSALASRTSAAAASAIDADMLVRTTGG
ncbi:MAG TPA: VOC family protein [Candidatus Methylomirabilis sp.]|nr:VOC family protein [Candidatus Methylomirabilis sp.]